MCFSWSLLHLDRIDYAYSIEERTLWRWNRFPFMLTNLGQFQTVKNYMILWKYLPIRNSPFSFSSSSVHYSIILKNTYLPCSNSDQHFLASTRCIPFFFLEILVHPSLVSPEPLLTIQKVYLLLYNGGTHLILRSYRSTLSSGTVLGYDP